MKKFMGCIFALLLIVCMSGSAPPEEGKIINLKFPTTIDGVIVCVYKVGDKYGNFNQDIVESGIDTTAPKSKYYDILSYQLRDYIEGKNTKTNNYYEPVAQAYVEEGLELELYLEEGTYLLLSDKRPVFNPTKPGELPDPYFLNYMPAIFTVSESNSDFSRIPYGLKYTESSNSASPDIRGYECSLTVNKVWDDNNNELGKRPNQIIVNLLKDGNIRDTVILNDDNEWTHTWSYLNNFHEPYDVSWSVEEIAPEGYECKYTTNEMDNSKFVTIKNSYTGLGGNKSINVVKVWDDNDNESGERPSEISVDLKYNGKVHSSAILSEDNNWRYVWNNLSEDIDWTVEETSVPYAYSCSYKKDGNTIVITNTCDYLLEPDPPPDSTSVRVLKIWNDSNDAAGCRPSEVRVNLLGNGVIRDSVTLSMNNNWRYTWNDLSSDINWSVVENTVPSNYEVSYDKQDSTYIITNTYTDDIPPDIPPDIPDDPDTGAEMPDTGNPIASWVLIYLAAITCFTLVVIIYRRFIQKF